jgi:hypothetical protein
MFAPTVLAAQYAGVFELLETTRVDARAVQPAPIVFTPKAGQDVLSGDFSASATARLRLTNRRWTWNLGYSPTISLSAIELGFQPQVLQSLNGSVGWTGRFVTMTASEAGSYGHLSIAQLYQVATPAAGPAAGVTPGVPVVGGVPTAAQSAAAPITGIDYASSYSAGTISIRTGRHELLTMSGGYSLSGGFGENARAYLPQQFGPFAALAFAESTTRTDAFVTLLSAQQTTTYGVCPGFVATVGTTAAEVPICREQTPVGQVLETFRHLLSQKSVFTVGVGVAPSVVVNQDNGAREAVVVPVAVATYTQALGLGQTSNLSISAGFTPTVDVRTGLLSDRLQTTATMTDAVAPATQLTVTAGLLQSIPFAEDPYPLTGLNATVETKILVDRQTDLLLGLQEYWQIQRDYPPFESTLGYAAVVLHPTAWLF